jgi:surfactin synthase thioesterase subunit
MQQVPQQDEIANEKSLQWLMKRFDVGFRHTTDPQAQVDQPQKLFGCYAGGKQGFAFWVAVESVGRMTPEELFTASLAPGQVPRTWCRCRHKTAEKRRPALVTNPWRFGPMQTR